MEPKTWLGKLFWDIGRAIGGVHQAFRPRYVKYLEKRLSYLEAENRGLWKSLTGLAGAPVPQIEHDSVAQRQPRKPQEFKLRKSWGQVLGDLEADNRTNHAANLAAMRKTLEEKAKIERGKKVEREAAAPPGNGGAGA
ncbi:MAG: hypothetical protein V3S55_08340 [Nitrospiraceae bacterium]